MAGAVDPKVLAVRARVRAYDLAHPEQARARLARWKAKNGDRAREQAAERAARKRSEEMLRTAAKRATAAGLPFDLTLDDVVIPDLCPLLGVVIHRGVGRSPYSPSLDRIDPRLGYVRGNVWVVSHRANTIKSDATPEEIATVARNLAARVGPRNY